MIFVHTTIGVPGCGKSTFIKKFLLYLPIVSPDSIREEFGEVYDQSNNDKVWDEAYRRLGDHLSKGQHVVFDATQAHPKFRKEFLDFVKERDGHPIGYLFKTPLDVSKERNSLRDRVVPDHIIEKMHQSLIETPPSLEEGFHKLYSVEITGLSYAGHSIYSIENL